MKKEKILIVEGKLKGQLKNLEQQYIINYMPEEDDYCDKIELAILLVEGEKKYAYRSLRFTQPVQLLSFIVGLIRSYFLFSKKRRLMRPDNYNYYSQKFFEKAKEAIRNT